MLKIRSNHNSIVIYSMFFICLSLIVGLFVYRVAGGSIVTPMSDGQIIMSSHRYQFGAIYDRNNNLIVHGEGDGVVWDDSRTKKAFDEILGINIEESSNSRITICGNCPWLFGTEDNRFSVYDLVHPSSQRQGGSVRLTLDKDLQEYVNSIVEAKGYENVYVVISNYKTGELLAVYGNVLKNAMHPGSTIKPILAAAVLSLDEKNSDCIYNCISDNHNFYTEEGPFRINCVNNAAHGVMNMEDGMAYSCNGYFINLLQKVDRVDLLKELNKWGFDTSISYSQFMYWDHSFVGKNNDTIDYMLAAIGQANAYITPAGLNFCTNTLLNHGVLAEPIWFTDKQSEQNTEWIKIDPEMGERTICDSNVADCVEQMMLEVTARGTGASFYMPGFAAKTGTAQKTNENGELSGSYTVWTTGGLVNDETPYSITVCLDNVSESVSSSDAGKLAQEILIHMTEGGE